LHIKDQGNDSLRFADLSSFLLIPNTAPQTTF
jgi:hypothetical protein